MDTKSDAHSDKRSGEKQRQVRTVHGSHLNVGSHIVLATQLKRSQQERLQGNYSDT